MIKKKTTRTRAFKQYLIATAARDASTVLMPGEAPGVFAVQELTYKPRKADAALGAVFWARELYNQGQDFLGAQVEVKTVEVPARRRS
jgi:hypothetical protein